MYQSDQKATQIKHITLYIQKPDFKELLPKIMLSTLINTKKVCNGKVLIQNVLWKKQLNFLQNSVIQIGIHF